MHVVDQIDSKPPRVGRGRPRRFDREEALDRAMQVFWEKGFVATSMTDLTAAMGIAAPSLYAAFGSKEDLFAEALDRYEDRVRRLTAEVLDTDQPLRDQVETALRLSARVEDQANPTGCMVIMACEQRAELSPDLNDRLKDKRVLGAQLFHDRLKKAVEVGELSKNTDIIALTQFYATLQRGLAVSRKTGGTADELELTIQMAMKAWDGLTASA